MRRPRGNVQACRGTFSGFTVGVTYSFGRDSVNAGPSQSVSNCAVGNAGDSGACRPWSLLAKYDAANWGLAGAPSSPDRTMQAFLRVLP